MFVSYDLIIVHSGCYNMNPEPSKVQVHSHCERPTKLAQIDMQAL